MVLECNQSMECDELNSRGRKRVDRSWDESIGFLADLPQTKGKDGSGSKIHPERREMKPERSI